MLNSTYWILWTILKTWLLLHLFLNDPNNTQSVVDIQYSKKMFECHSQFIFMNLEIFHRGKIIVKSAVVIKRTLTLSTNTQISLLMFIMRVFASQLYFLANRNSETGFSVIAIVIWPVNCIELWGQVAPTEWFSGTVLWYGDVFRLKVMINLIE